jgi:hypothetical protein
MRQVDDPHDAIDETEPRGDEKQNTGVENGIQNLND